MPLLCYSLMCCISRYCLQVAIVFTCSRLVQATAYTYLPLFLTESLQFTKVAIVPYLCMFWKSNLWKTNSTNKRRVERFAQATIRIVRVCLKLIGKSSPMVVTFLPFWLVHKFRLTASNLSVTLHCMEYRPTMCFFNFDRGDLFFCLFVCFFFWRNVNYINHLPGKIKQNVANFEREHVCQNTAAMATSSSGHIVLPYIRLVAFNKIFKKLETFKVSACTIRLPPPSSLVCTGLKLSIAVGIRNDKHATFCILKLQSIDVR